MQEFSAEGLAICARARAIDAGLTASELCGIGTDLERLLGSVGCRDINPNEITTGFAIVKTRALAKHVWALLAALTAPPVESL